MLCTDVHVHPSRDSVPQPGTAGCYLVQEKEPRKGKVQCYQHCMSEVEFQDMYEPVMGGSDSSEEEDNSLRLDFDFALYLSILVGRTVARIVNVTAFTWLWLEGNAAHTPYV